MYNILRGIDHTEGELFPQARRRCMTHVSDRSRGNQINACFEECSTERDHSGRRRALAECARRRAECEIAGCEGHRARAVAEDASFVSSNR